MLFYQVLEEEKVQEKAAERGAYLLQGLAKLRDDFEVVGDVRGKGLMIGVELVNDKVLGFTRVAIYFGRHATLKPK